MAVLKKLFKFYLQASIHVALAVVSLSAVSALFAGVRIPDYLLIFTFFATLASYNIIKYGHRFKSENLLASKQGRPVLVLTVVAALIALYSSRLLPRSTWSILGVVAVLLALYVIPVYPAEKNLRSLGVGKIILVALVWCGVSHFFPLVTVGQGLDWDIGISAVQRLILVLVLIIPFEIRDTYYDPPQLKTLPRRLGTKKTIFLGMGLALIAFALVFLKDQLTILEIISRGLLTLILLFTLKRTPAGPSATYAGFWVEGIPIIWLLLTLFLGKVL